MTKTPPSLSELMDNIAAQEGINVNFEDTSGICLEFDALQLRPVQFTHHASYCHFAKMNGQLPLCGKNKQKSIAKARSGAAAPFSGYCPFGIWDHAQPVIFDNELMGIFYLGSLKHQRALASVSGKSFQGDNPVWSENKAEACSYWGRFLADYLQLLLKKWQREGQWLGKKKSEPFYAEAARRFIQTNFHRNVGLQQLADQLRVHPNHLGQIIRRQSGSHFRKLLLDYRMEQAKIILKSRQFPISHVAHSCGFHDSNYFSTVFKKECGMSPREYRQKG